MRDVRAHDINLLFQGFAKRQMSIDGNDGKWLLQRFLIKKKTKYHN